MPSQILWSRVAASEMTLPGICSAALDDCLQASIRISEYPLPEPGENDATLVVRDDRRKGDVLKIKSGVWILELPVTIKKHVWTFEDESRGSRCVGCEAAHGADRRRVRKWSLNQSEIEPVESDQTSFSPNPQIAIGRLTNGINLSSEKSFSSLPFVMYVL